MSKGIKKNRARVGPPFARDLAGPVPSYKGTLFERGKTPAEVMKLIEGNQIKDDNELPSNLKRGGLDPTAKNFGLMSANLFPKERNLAFESTDLALILDTDSETERGGGINNKARKYKFIAKWKRSYVLKHLAAKDFQYPRELTVTSKADGTSYDMVVQNTENIPGRASFLMTVAHKNP